MVKLSFEMMTKKPLGQSRLRGDEDVAKFLSKLTHLSLQERKIHLIESELSACPHLMVLYLYDNLLTEIPTISKNQRLTSLYLQNNNISYIENLGIMKNLTKLHLGNNCISVIEGLEGLSSLEELYVDHQQIPPSDALIFDPLSINAISTSLRIADVSSNHLKDISAFGTCQHLEEFIACNNQLSCVQELCEVIKGNWMSVVKINFQNNPVAKEHRYRDCVIYSALGSLEFLDDKEVTMVSKQFIKGFQDKMMVEKEQKMKMMKTVGDNQASRKVYLPFENRRISVTNAAGDQEIHLSNTNLGNNYPEKNPSQHYPSNPPIYKHPSADHVDPFLNRATNTSRHINTPNERLNTNNGNRGGVKTKVEMGVWKKQQEDEEDNKNHLKLNLSATKTVMHDKKASRIIADINKHTNKHTHKQGSPNAPPPSSLGFYTE